MKLRETPGEEKALGRSCSSFPVHKETYKRDGLGLFIRPYSDRNGFKLKEIRVRLGINSLLRDW